ncbi:glycosyltransferase family 2 protein [Bradyrhizobium sp. SYSU BS000235]|uniref:glycosyltransferase family 2 protein n=1 Tax=Bradyrhizobium sp. SYSU BS000235 TaxID=3411332 RepID=UPI003C723C16
MPKVSVITVCRNAEADIAATIASVQAQDYPDIEHVFVDGASTDRTLEIIRASRPARVVSEPDAGIYHAMQKGIGLSTGEVLYFLNSGDVLADDRVVSDAVQFFDLTGADAVFGNLLPVANAHFSHPMYRPGRVIDQGYFANRQMFFDQCIHHQTVFYRRAIFTRCGYICDEAAANGEYFLHMCAFVREGFSARHLPRLIARFALGGYSTSDFEIEWRRFEAARDILRRRFFQTKPLMMSKSEYLHAPPSFMNRLKMLSRDPRMRWLFLAVQQLRYGARRYSL